MFTIKAMVHSLKAQDEVLTETSSSSSLIYMQKAVYLAL